MSMMNSFRNVSLFFLFIIVLSSVVVSEGVKTNTDKQTQGMISYWKTNTTLGSTNIIYEPYKIWIPVGQLLIGDWIPAITESSAPLRVATMSGTEDALLSLQNDYGQDHGAGIDLYNFASAEYMTSNGELGYIDFTANYQESNGLQLAYKGAKISVDSPTDWNSQGLRNTVLSVSLTKNNVMKKVFKIGTSGEIQSESLKGSGNAFVCVGEDGVIYRSSTLCN